VVSGTRRFRRRTWRRWLVPLSLVAFLLLRVGLDWWHGGADRPTDVVLPEGLYQVVRVVDGDTLLVKRPRGEAAADPEDVVLRVRLLGIDCPESVKPGHPVEPWALESSRFTRDFVSGNLVRLRFDKRRIDKYHRRLAYVFVGEKMLNEELLRAGLARVMVFPGDSESIARGLRSAQAEARANARGIWSP
jgi:micrococcal nuclease